VVSITKPKNLKRYKAEFKDIPSDEYERLQEYLTNHPLSKKDREKLRDRILEINSIKTNYIKIVFDIIPEPTPRPRLSLGRFYVGNSKANNTFVKLMVNKDKDLYHFIKTPCEFIVKNYFPIPKAFNRVDTILAELGMIDMVSRPDWDNLGKTYSDMVQKYILADDSLITNGRSYKYYSLKPRVEIIIKYKECHTCKHNMKIIENSVAAHARKAQES
jgi:Holliday junction resolvase RusA-like endonuclease